MESNKTYRAIRHDIVRARQQMNHDDVHHPNEKISQITNVLPADMKNVRVLELFAGRGNLTKKYRDYGEVVCFDKKYCKTGNSFREFHRLIANLEIFDIVDLDPYGFPNRLFPDAYMLIEDGYMFVTMPKPSVNIMNGITRTHLKAYYGEHNPPLRKILDVFIDWGICHWRAVSVLDVIDCKSIWRIALRVERVKATDYTGVRNRADESTKPILRTQLSLF